ncbi:MAG: DUF2934 domain-containing protein [Acidihalobacter sp.]|jgi:hypothetical protein|uniref:DUF2934 domain-containing protein n=1 Tax=Acidihalobacter sp. TaxID=1872108 RepID=UPI00307D4555
MSDTTEPTKPRRRTATTKTAASSKTAKPAAKKAAAKPAAKTASKTATTAKSGTKTTRSRKKAASPVTAEQRYRMIAEAAYLIAESHGFDSGRTLDDWLQAEAQIDRQLSGTTQH